MVAAIEANPTTQVQVDHSEAIKDFLTDCGSDVSLALASLNKRLSSITIDALAGKDVGGRLEEYQTLVSAAKERFFTTKVEQTPEVPTDPVKEFVNLAATKGVTKEQLEAALAKIPAEKQLAAGLSAAYSIGNRSLLQANRGRSSRDMTGIVEDFSK